MSEVTDADARAVLQEHGRKVGKRGRLSAGQWDEYREVIAGAPDIPGDDHVTDLGDPPAPKPWVLTPHSSTSTPVDAGPVSTPVDARSSGSTPVDAEQRPRRVEQPGGGRIRSLWERRPRGSAAAAPPPRGKNRKGGGRGSRGKRDERPWRPTAHVIETTWQRLAQAAGAIPPLQRILAAQAPLAGIVFEGQLRETIVDRVLLQPAARFEAQGEALAAMVGVPAFTCLVAFRGKAQMAPGPDGQPKVILQQDGQPLWDAPTELGMIAPLRYCLISWMAVSQRYAEEVIAQGEATIEQARQADEIIAWIFKVPDPGATFEDVQAEARARAAGFTAPGGPPPPPSRAHGSSAFAPALTASVLPPETVLK